MSRARDLANLGDGVSGSDITTGTLGNTVQDNITRLGTVTTGTMKNTIHSDTTFPAGHVIRFQTVLNETSSALITSDTTQAFGSGLTISTPESGSKIIVWAIGGNVWLCQNGTEYNTRCGINFYQNSTNTFYFTASSEAHTIDDSDYIAPPGCAMAEYTSASTGDIEIKCRVGRTGTKSGKWFCNSSQPIKIVAMEIKQ